MASITTYFRLEPQPQRGDLAAGAAAPIHDPVWLLARQWQMSEFAGHDGGSPIVARWRGTASPPSRFVAGPIPPETRFSAPRFDADAAPLEAQIERATTPLAPTSEGAAGLRLAIDAGRHFLALLASMKTKEDYRAAVLSRYALQPLTEAQLAELDPASAAYARLHTGRSPDGRRLLAELTGRDLPRLDVPIDQMDRAEVKQAAATWLSWLAILFDYADPDAVCWQPSRFEYTATLAGRRAADTSGEITLTAQRYDSDTIDWYEFDVNGDINCGTQASELGPNVIRTSMPAAVTAPGLPAPRFWEFEDGRLNIAALEPAKTDLAQLLLVETLSGYGNDWYVIGVDLPVGRIVASTSLTVSDTFGAKTLLQPAGTKTIGRWGLFRHAMPVDPDEAEGTAISNLLYLAPRLAQPLIGPVVEQVTLTRDEQANIAWGIEQLRESPLQLGIALSDARPAEPAADPQDAPQYKLFRRPPPHWVPLLPVRTGDDAQIALARGSISDDTGAGQPVGSVTSILAGDRDGTLLVPEEEVPDDGLIVQRVYQAARHSDGSLHVWAAYRTRPSGSLPSANLRFDTIGD